MLMIRSPDFLDVDRMKVELVGKEKKIKDFLQYANKGSNNSFKILRLTSIDTKGESLLSKLTHRQRQMLLTAYALGYYDVPRRISSDDLSRHLNVDKSTVIEHLRKAERKLIGSIIAGQERKYLIDTKIGSITAVVSSMIILYIVLVEAFLF
jgi:predicted DNA binding protein